MEQDQGGTDKKFSALKTPLTGKQGALVVLGVLVLMIIIGIFVGSSVENGGGQYSKKTPTPQSAEPSFISFICSKSENSHKAYYYFVKHLTTNESLPLTEKIIDVTVRISTIRNDRENWDINFLCSPKNIDLPAYQWTVLTAGSDCGLGADISPCDVDFISDGTGVTDIKIAPQVGGYTSGVAVKFIKRGALLKVTGQPAK